ncbi:hypothetical protein BHE74_00057270 [Ensete ventricosum]|nr:hypothetical protein BHE74_00057270 [Ensete ventricosum]
MRLVSQASGGLYLHLLGSNSDWRGYGARSGMSMEGGVRRKSCNALMHSTLAEPPAPHSSGDTPLDMSTLLLRPEFFLLRSGPHFLLRRHYCLYVWAPRLGRHEKVSGGVSNLVAQLS